MQIRLQDARRLAIVKQHLDGKPRPSMLDVIRDLGCLQLDPISAVARSHQIVLWSRLGNYDLSAFDDLVYRSRDLFEYWAHVASFVLTEDYPIHQWRMRYYATGNSSWAQRTRAFVKDNADLKDAILKRIKAHGASFSRDFKHTEILTEWVSSGWTSGRNVSRMIDYLWQTGVLMVSHRQGIQRAWDLAERCLPDWTPREDLSDEEMTSRAAQKAIKALGVATAAQIKSHYVRGRYVSLPDVLRSLLKAKIIQRVRLENIKATYYIHADDLPLLERIQQGDFVPKTTLLSPFDNLIADRQRTQQLWDFTFRIEIYVPAAKRQYGYYVLPVLHGDRFIGRIDPRMDRKTKTLYINAIHQESDAPDNAQALIRTAIESLAEWLGAERINYSE